MAFYSKIAFMCLLLSSCTLKDVTEGTTDRRAASGGQTRETAPHPAYIDAVPTFVGVTDGSVHYIYVTVLDSDGNPVSGLEVKAAIADPSVATLDNDRRLTDEYGRAVFTLTGVAFPEITTLTFYVDDLFYTIILDGFSPSMG